MHLIKNSSRLDRKDLIKIGCWVLFVIMSIAIVPAWADDRDNKADEKPLFKIMYYDKASGLGIIQDTKGIAVGEKNALFRIHIRENDEHKIFYIEIYPENLSLPGTHIDEFPVNTINMMLKTYPKYNLM